MPPIVTTPSDPSSLIGQVLEGRYRLEGLIGVGGMGRVYRGVRVGLGKPVAIKVLPLEMQPSEQEELLARFTREAQATAAIRHRNVVEIIDFGQTSDCIYFVMELLEGEVLADLLGEGRRMEPARLVPLTVQIAAGLHAAHVLGIVHRDVKPANVIVEASDDGERPKVLDFGLAKLNDGLKLTKRGMVFGTASYMSPEQALGQPLDPRTDVYSLGCMLFEGLTGWPPFREGNFMELLGRHLQDPVPSLKERCPSLEFPAGLEGLVRGMLEKKAEHRVANMEAVQKVLTGLDLPSAPRLRRQAPVRPVPVSPLISQLAFLFLAFASLTDDKLETSEVELISKELAAWDPRLRAETLQEILAKVRREYEAIADDKSRRARAFSSMDILEGLLSADERRKVFAGMWRIAGADGVILEAERDFIMATVAHFDALVANRHKALDEDELDITERLPPVLDEALPRKDITERIAPVFDGQGPAPKRELTQIVAPSFSEPEPPRFLEPADLPVPPLPPGDSLQSAEVPSVALPASPAAVKLPSGEAPSFSSEVFSEHFGQCSGVLELMLARRVPLGDPSKPLLAQWESGLAVLRLQRGKRGTDFLLGMLEEVDGEFSRRRCAALVLLLLEPKEAPELLRLRASTTPELLAAVLAALELWRGKGQTQALLCGLSRASEETRPAWLQALARCGVDLGRERLDVLLKTKSNAELASALRLLCVHADRQEYAQDLVPLLFAQDVEVRRAAMISGVVVGTPGALLLCKRLGRGPHYPELCLLHGVHASERELAELAEWSLEEDAPEHGSFVVAYCGHRAGMEAALSRYRRDGCARALAGLRCATGFDGEDEELESWWARHQARFHSGVRYLRGREPSLSGLQASLRHGDSLVWQAHALECCSRSRGELSLPMAGLPDALDAAIASLKPAALTWLT